MANNLEAVIIPFQDDNYYSPYPSKIEGLFFDKNAIGGYTYIMKKFWKSFFLGICFSLCLWGGFFGNAQAQENNRPFSVTALPFLNEVYALPTMIEQLPYVMVNNASLLVLHGKHAAADQEYLYQIDSATVGDFFFESKNFEEFYQKIRIDIMKFLLARWYMDFNIQPYQEGNYAIKIQSWDFMVMKNIIEYDGLDRALHDALSWFTTNFDDIKTYERIMNFKPIGISSDAYENLWTLFLFKNEQDLRDLWYELISRKSRANVDRDYRRHNIMAAFHNIGNVRLILPGEIFNLAREIRYRPDQGDIMYMSGYATFGAGARMIYGGWLCGVATALYQGSLTNLGFQILEYSAHSTYYRNLFNAEINGTRISTPGLDATIYAPIYNLQLKNIREYPIITVFNFGWWESDEEQVFTLSKLQDRGSFEFVWRRGMCFTWNINGKSQTNCYDYIKNY